MRLTSWSAAMTTDQATSTFSGSCLSRGHACTPCETPVMRTSPHSQMPLGTGAAPAPESQLHRHRQSMLLCPSAACTWCAAPASHAGSAGSAMQVCCSTLAPAALQGQGRCHAPSPRRLQRLLLRLLLWKRCFWRMQLGCEQTAVSRCANVGANAISGSSRPASALPQLAAGLWGLHAPAQSARITVLQTGCHHSRVLHGLGKGLSAAAPCSSLIELCAALGGCGGSTCVQRGGRQETHRITDQEFLITMVL